MDLFDLVGLPSEVPKKKHLAQGQSELVTERKQRGLSYAFLINRATVKKNVWIPSYDHIELNAGPGYNDGAGCIGSPLTFLRVFNGYSKFTAHFVDRDVYAIWKLKAVVGDDDRCRYHCCDNGEFLRRFLRNSSSYGRKKRYGSILSDPNGADVPIEEIREISEAFPKIDLIFHWNSNITLRLRGSSGKPGIKPDQITLARIPLIINKRFWLIREPLGPHQFAMLIGRNFRGGDYKKEGFYYLDSSEGQEIMDRCSRTRKDRNAKPNGSGLGGDLLEHGSET